MQTWNHQCDGTKLTTLPALLTKKKLARFDSYIESEEETRSQHVLKLKRCVPTETKSLTAISNSTGHEFE
jgi:hypothetical protein